MLATTYTFKTQKFQTLKYMIAWLGAIFTSCSILTLVAFGAIPPSLGVYLIFGLFMIQYTIIIYQNYKFSFESISVQKSRYKRENSEHKVNF